MVCGIAHLVYVLVQITGPKLRKSMRCQGAYTIKNRFSFILLIIQLLTTYILFTIKTKL